MTEGTERVCAFSDGVFAIACTLLILEIRLPHDASGGTLSHQLLALWPSYVAFALSFFVILVTWITHHDLLRLVNGTNRSIQLTNGACLSYVTFIPFPTTVLAAHLGGPEMKTAVVFYCATFVYGSSAFNLLVYAISRSKCRRPEVTDQSIGRLRRGFRITLCIYIAATLIAFIAPWVALAINIAVRVYLLTIRPGAVAAKKAASVSP